MAGGKVAKDKGELAELLFEGSCSTLQANGLLICTKNYPEFIPLRRIAKTGQIQGYYKSKGPPDYVLTTKFLGSVWLEVKLFTAQDRKT